MGWRRYFRRRFWDEERARELESYLAIETAENIARGMPLEEASAAARRKLGNVTLVREEIYRMNSAGFLETMWNDVRFGIRVLRKNFASTLVSWLSLALGIGATTALFSAVYGVLISPYPYAKADQIWAPEVRDLKNPRQFRMAFFPSEQIEIQKLPAVAEVMGTDPETAVLTGDRPPENFTLVHVTGNGFQFLGVAPILGRTIMPSDLGPAGEPEPVIVLSAKAWQRLFNGSPDAIGKRVTLNDVRYTVIGVMPPRFGWWTNDGGWIPLKVDPKSNSMLATIVRLRPGVPREAAEQQVGALLAQLAKVRPEQYPKTGFKTRLVNYLDMTVASGEMQTSLKLLFGAVGFLLLIACANVANLQMARATVRAREIAVRMSLGAARARILRQLLTESVLLSVIGGIAGILFAIVITKGMVALMPDFNVPNEARITVNGYVLAFSAIISVLTGILFGLAPAMQCSRPDLVEALKDGARGGGPSSAGGRTRSLLVFAEVTLSVILLVAASLTVRAFLDLQKVDPGFQRDRVLVTFLPLPAKRYSTYEQRVAFTQSVLEKVQTVPGVQSVAIGNGGIPFGGPRSGFAIEGQQHPDSERVMMGFVSAGFLQTLGIPLRAGRALAENEVAHADPVALINEAAAKLWPAGQSAVGGHIKLNWLEKPPNGLLVKAGIVPSLTVVGVLADVKNDGLDKPAAPAVYVPYTVIAPTGRTLVVRTQTEPMLLLNAVRREVQSLDREQALSRPLTLEEIVGMQTVQPRFNMALFSAFAALGLALAGIGIFSVLSYTVARRTHEIGIRIALGAERAHVLRMVLESGGKLVFSGMALGLGVSSVLARVLRSEYFAIPRADALGVLAVVILLSGAALVACLIPARRAAKVDPIVALRHE